MTNPTDLHDIIFVTDKYGRRNKTGDIEKLQYDSRKDVYYITYKDGKTYPCRSADLQIIKNCLKDKQSATVFDYLLQMAQFSDSKLPPAEPVALIRHKWPATSCGKPLRNASHRVF